MNITHIQTVPPAMYNLDKLVIKEGDSYVDTFIEYMILNKRVGFDIGRDILYACKTLFVVDYKRRSIIQKGKPFDNTDWIAVSSDELHTAMEKIFTGQYSPTGIDVIIRLQMSGIKVYLTGIPENLPEKPIRYMREIRKRIKELS